ncbi:MAG: hypothetical protein ACLUPV_10245 [Bilophila wadsworthia]
MFARISVTSPRLLARPGHSAPLTVIEADGLARPWPAIHAGSWP